MEHIKLPINTFRSVINNGFAGKEPWQIVTVTTSTVLLTVWLWEFLQHNESMYLKKLICLCF